MAVVLLMSEDYCKEQCLCKALILFVTATVEKPLTSVLNWPILYISNNDKKLSCYSDRSVL